MNRPGLIRPPGRFRPLLFVCALASMLSAGCQYLQPRSVDDIERGRLPAPIEREDSNTAGTPVRPPVPGDDSVGASVDADQARIAEQRERSARDGVVVFSVGASALVDLAEGSSLSLQFEAEGTRERGVIAVDLTCRTVPCSERILTIDGQSVLLNHSLTVLALTPGRWKLQALRLNEVSARVDGKTSIIRLSKAPWFDVRIGHATYLGGFVVTPAPDGKDGALADGIASLPVLRYAAIEDDMARALSDFPDARGRRMLNATRGLAKPQLLR